MTSLLLDDAGIENHSPKRQPKYKLTASRSMIMPSRVTSLGYMTIPRGLSIPTHMSNHNTMFDNMSEYRSGTEVQVDKHTTPSSLLTVHSVSTGCVATVTQVTTVVQVPTPESDILVQVSTPESDIQWL